MMPFYIFVISSLLLRGIGWLGVSYLNSWQQSVCVALTITFLFTGATHFTEMKQDYAALIPSPFPKSLWLIYLTGILEIAGAIGLLLPPRSMDCRSLFGSSFSSFISGKHQCRA